MSELNERTIDHVSPKELKTLLTTLLTENFPILIKGKPGIGKSAIVEQVARNLDELDQEQGGKGFDFLKSEPFLKNPIDYRGMPGIVEGEANFLPFAELRHILYADKPLIVFVDDLGWAANSVQQAVGHLMLSREINGERISDHVRFVAATNRKEDKAGVMGILEPVKSRFLTIVQLEPNYEDWVLDWAPKNGMPDILRAFIYAQPQLLDKFEPTGDIINTPSPRTVAHVGNLINSGLPKDLEIKAIAGAAGAGFAFEFIGFKETWQSLPDFDEAIKNPDSVEIDESDPSSMYAIAVGMASRAYIGDEEYKSDNPEWRIENYVKIIDKMPDEFAIVGMKEVMNWFPQVVNTTVYEKDWAVRHSDTFLGH